MRETKNTDIELYEWMSGNPDLSQLRDRATDYVERLKLALEAWQNSFQDYLDFGIDGVVPFMRELRKLVAASDDALRRPTKKAAKRMIYRRNRVSKALDVVKHQLAELG